MEVYYWHDYMVTLDEMDPSSELINISWVLLVYVQIRIKPSIMISGW